MEDVIQFLEEYWGVSIAGGVTVGTLITFIIIQFKAFIIAKQQHSEVNTAVDASKTITAQYNKLEQQMNSLISRNNYLEQVNTATFKALSYLVVASKLPTEDKLALQAEFLKLTTPTVVSTPVVVSTPIVQTVTETVDENKEAVQAVVTNVVNVAADLLSKYTGVK